MGPEKKTLEPIGSSEMLVFPGMRKIYGNPYIKCLLPFARQTSHVPSFPTSRLPRFYTSYAYAWPRCVVMSISRTFTKMRGRMVILRSLKKSVAPSTLKRSCYDFFLWKPPETAFEMPTNANRKCNLYLAWCEKESDPFIPSLHLCQGRTKIDHIDMLFFRPLEGQVVVTKGDLIITSQFIRFYCNCGSGHLAKKALSPASADLWFVNRARLWVHSS